MSEKVVTLNEDEYAKIQDRVMNVISLLRGIKDPSVVYNSDQKVMMSSIINSVRSNAENALDEMDELAGFLKIEE